MYRSLMAKLLQDYLAFAVSARHSGTARYRIMRRFNAPDSIFAVVAKVSAFDCTRSWRFMYNKAIILNTIGRITSPLFAVNYPGFAVSAAAITHLFAGHWSKLASLI